MKSYSTCPRSRALKILLPDLLYGFIPKRSVADSQVSFFDTFVNANNEGMSNVINYPISASLLVEYRLIFSY